MICGIGIHYKTGTQIKACSEVFPGAVMEEKCDEFLGTPSPYPFALSAPSRKWWSMARTSRIILPDRLFLGSLERPVAMPHGPHLEPCLYFPHPFTALWNLVRKPRTWHLSTAAKPDTRSLFPTFHCGSAWTLGEGGNVYLTNVRDGRSMSPRLSAFFFLVVEPPSGMIVAIPPAREPRQRDPPPRRRPKEAEPSSVQGTMRGFMGGNPSKYPTPAVRLV
ncbi:uncharacterized protein BDZ83DRAFT_328374 [Colletotrichum acutatum]|uniref:Uncharacterized protein n=1 Tax=Glomerella acutata TaxID=27357 RepID=A0AAD8XEB9_GLOAC|nr:uncharacterized protein BDZ83DRAFT_328374 [Colletotrichum acutatum]KAK1724634.1 hypothetical protein BDZ83DRAFT_328374 [Colletotrichum acutatum]